jgi:hypothetical protein
MAKILSPDAAPALRTVGTACNYRLVGLEVTTAVNSFSGGSPGILMDVSNEGVSAPSQCTHHIIIDRCYIHASESINCRRGVALNGAYMAVVESYIARINSAGYDGQTIVAWNGPGPYLIRNNHLEAASENIMFGGAGTLAASMIPSDITVEKNYLVKPLSWDPYDPHWDGITWDVKNLFELKCAQRVLVDSNVMEHCWYGGQSGEAVLMQTANSGSPGNWPVIQDVTFTHNICRHARQGVLLLGIVGSVPNAQGNHRLLLQNNIFDDVTGFSEWSKPGDTSATDGQSGAMWMAGNGGGETGHYLTDVNFDHNTCMGTGWFGFSTTNLTLARHAYTNNIVQCLPCSPGKVHNIVGGNAIAFAQAALNRYFPGDSFARNVCFDPNGAPTEVSKYNAGQFIGASAANVQFVNYNRGNGGDYRLQATSPYKGAGTDGKDIGADAATVYSRTAGVVDS